MLLQSNSFCIIEEMEETEKNQAPTSLKEHIQEKCAKTDNKIANLAKTLSKSSVNQNMKFTMMKARTLDKQTLTDGELTSPDEIPNYILKTLMIVNYNALEFKLTPQTKREDKTKNKNKKSNYDSDDSDDEDEVKNKDSNSDESADENVVEINPMDGLLWVFHCSDTFLKRNLAIKLSACQLSVPFLLPDPAAPSTNVTMLLSALESITKSWKGASNNNESAQKVFATEYPFPVVSFIRIGENTFSKSWLINKVMSDANSHHDFFFHKNIKGGDVKRKVVDGLVELSWFLPGGSEKQTLQSEICFANLRGDAKTFTKQLNVLSKVSSVLCILLPSEYPDERMMTILKEATKSEAKVILIFNEKRQEQAKEYFNDLRSKNRGKLSLITNANKANEYDFLQSIRVNIQKNLNNVKATPLVEMASFAHEYGVQLDDHQLPLGIETGVETWLKRGTNEAKNLLKLQMHVPKFADLDREKYCPKRCGIKRDVNEIYEDIEAEKEAQKESFKRLDKRIFHCLDSIAVMDENERNLVLDKIKLQLDKNSLQIMASLHQEYRQASLNLQKKRKKELSKSDTRSSEEERLKQLEESISKCSFGLEHIIRELAQLHQLNEIPTNDYAGAAAEMLLSGQPLELLDGDSSYIPLPWFDAVYCKLEQKTNNAKIFVISVLGVQSSGKSTMLNTMFGLEFPVSAGRCTRGAFASLIPVGDALKSASNIQYLLVIDTEGLRGSTDSQRRDHDNELATFSIGVADVTIVNIFGENYNDMKEFLEIAVHAFLKMKLVKEKKTCKIVHQNVAATDATDKLTLDRFHLKQDLDKMAKLAAHQENCEGKFQRIDDIISFDENEDVFYIPSLLKGSPPMAPVNPNYGRAIQRIRENIITLMCSKERVHIPVSKFRKRVSSLWKAIQKENFIFSFRNTIEVRAYTSLERKLFQESVYLMVMGMAQLEGKIQVALKRCTTRDERKEKWDESKRQIREEAEELRKKMEIEMKVFFETNEDKTTLEQWKENVMNKISQQNENQQKAVTRNCEATFSYLQDRQYVEEKEKAYEKELLQKAKTFIISAHNTHDAKKCKTAFEEEWQQWIVEVPQCQESKINLDSKMVDVLCDTSRVLNTEMTEKLKQKNFKILKFTEMAPVVDVDQLSINHSNKINPIVMQQQQQQGVVASAEIITENAIDEALDFAKVTSKSGARCTSNDLIQMYHKVITTINKETGESSFQFHKSLQCDILLYTFAKAYKIFDEMDERFFEERDIRSKLEKNLRPRLEKYFVNKCNKMEKEVLAATEFVDVLQSHIESDLNWRMGPKVAKELKKKSTYQSKTAFHASILIQLGEEGKFESYIPYLGNPVKFLRNKLAESIEYYCLKQEPVSITVPLENETKKMKEKLFEAISKANELTKSANEKLTFWIRRFVENFSTLPITQGMFAVAAVDEDLKDLDVFEAKVRANVEEFLESLIKRGVDEASYRKWDPAPHDSLFTWMFGCTSLCPFCKGLCDQTFEKHELSHSTLIHRPNGLAGCKEMKTQVLSTGICTARVAGKLLFRNSDTSFELHPYKGYQSVNSYYGSWSIPPDPSFEASTYWQWFMATFSKELAEHYRAKEPDIPSKWKERTFEQAREQLRQEYNI